MGGVAGHTSQVCSYADTSVSEVYPLLHLIPVNCIQFRSRQVWKLLIFFLKLRDYGLSDYNNNTMNILLSAYLWRNYTKQSVEVQYFIIFQPHDNEIMKSVGKTLGLMK